MFEKKEMLAHNHILGNDIVITSQGFLATNLGVAFTSSAALKALKENRKKALGSDRKIYCSTTTYKKGRASLKAKSGKARVKRTNGTMDTARRELVKFAVVQTCGTRQLKNIRRCPPMSVKWEREAA